MDALAIDKLMADLSDVHGRLEALHEALRGLVDPGDVERAVEVIGRIEDAAYEAALILSDDYGVEDDGGSLECEVGQVEENALGVAIQASFRVASTVVEDVASELTAESLVSHLHALLSDSFGDYHLASHQAYVYREGRDEDDAYIGIQIPMGRVVVEVEEL